MATEIKIDPFIKKLYRSILILLIMFVAGVWLFEVSLPAFVMGFLTGLAIGAFVMGFFTPRFPSILIDENGLFTQRTMWDQSFHWSDLRDVTLHKNKISVTLQKTGAGDTIRIPFLLRRKMPHIHEAISYHCSRFGVSFSSFQTKEREGFHAV